MDTILNKTIKVLTVTVLCIMLIIGAIFIVPPSYADNTDFPILPVFVNQQPYSLDFSVTYVTSSNVSQEYWVAADRDGVYGFIAPAVTEGRYTFYFAYPSDTFIDFNRTTIYSSTSAATNKVTNYSDTYHISYGAYGYNQPTIIANAPTFTSVEAALEALDNYVNSSGTFYDFPQVSSTTYISYEYIEGNGVMVYASPNTYHLLGSYNSSNSPTSQYCYIQNAENDCSFAVFSSVPLTVYSAFLNGGTYTYGVCSQYDTNKYYYVFPETITSNIDDSFSSLEEAQAAFSGGSGGGASGVTTAGALTFDLPAGNVAYIRPRAGSLGRLDVHYPYLSNTFGNAFPLSAYWASGVSSLPDSNTSFPLNGMSQINWSIDQTSVNGYGQSYNGYVTHAPFNSGWFVVYNPTYYTLVGADGTSSNLISPTIKISMQYAIEYHIYDLSMNLITNTSDSNTDYETVETGVVNPSNPDQWDKTSTLPNSEPTIGGQQDEVVMAQNYSISDYLHAIKETLTNFANNFVQLLTAPIAHIQRLISYGTAFMTSIAQFFTWLPEPVYMIIISALTVAVVIGVIKLLF